MRVSGLRLWSGRRRRFWLLVGAGGAAVALALGACTLAVLGFAGARLLEELAPQTTASVGEPAPDFALRDLEGKTVRLSELRGRPVLVNFFATWCGPCRAEMADLQKAQQENAGAGLIVLEVDQMESPGTVRSFLREENLQLRTVLDGAGAVSRCYGVRAIPTSFFIDRKGVIQSRYPGALGPAGLKKRLDLILPAGE